MEDKIEARQEGSKAAPAGAGGFRIRGMQAWGWSVCLLLWFFAGAAQAALDAVDDSYGVPFGAPLQVEPFGVLDNDTLDGGAVAVLVAGPSHGGLSCPSNASLQLCPDGAFEYTPDSTFAGTDSFTYRAQSAATLSGLATVHLSACSGGPTVFTCWQESSFLAKLAELGYVSFGEGFEGVAWDGARYPATAASVASLGITWTSNHPATNDITTGSGAAVTGNWGIYDPQHGVATGSAATCDVNSPPASCLYHDGFSGSRVAGEGALHGVGGYISGTAGANVAIVLEGAAQYGFGQLPSPVAQFFGVIDASPAGFRAYEFRELDGKVGQERMIFGDDFVFAIEPAGGNTPPVADAGADQTVSVGTTVTLNGSASSDADGDSLTYIWSLISVPAGSTAALSDPGVVGPTFVADKAGTYVAQLIVNDGLVDSAPDIVNVSTSNTAPVADAGVDQTVPVGATVTLNGSGSSDADGDVLTYDWSLTSVPAGSGAALSDPAAVMPTFVADLPGIYVAQLIVDDGLVSSAPATVVATASAPVMTGFSIDTAEWHAQSRTLILKGNGAAKKEAVRIWDAASLVPLDTVRAVGRGKSQARVRKLKVVPCRVAAEWRGNVVEADVANSPNGCASNVFANQTTNRNPKVDRGR